MFSLNSSQEPTRVINSRASTKKPLVWRRRKGVHGGATFTTYERPALAENKPVIKADAANDTFNLGRLILSIAAAFSHDTHAAQYDSLWLAQTVEDALSVAPEALTPTTITKTTYDVLKKFDELAAVQYAAKHHIITTVRRPGRPSISS